MASAGASLHDDCGPALLADGLQVGQDMFLREGFAATAVGEHGAVRLTGARIGGSLLCDGASFPCSNARSHNSLSTCRAAAVESPSRSAA
jgi:hypothetical protein